jgi:hypothetical protein
MKKSRILLIITGALVIYRYFSRKYKGEKREAKVDFKATQPYGRGLYFKKGDILYVSKNNKYQMPYTYDFFGEFFVNEEFLYEQLPNS